MLSEYSHTNSKGIAQIHATSVEIQIFSENCFLLLHTVNYCNTPYCITNIHITNIEFQKPTKIYRNLKLKCIQQLKPLHEALYAIHKQLGYIRCT